MIRLKWKEKDFSPIIKNIKPADIVLYHNMNPDLIGDGIEWFTSSIGDKKRIASHVDLYIGNNEVIGYTIGGCKKMKLSRYFEDYMKIYVLRIPKLVYEQEFKMIECAKKDLQDTRLYDYVSYLGFVFMSLAYKIGFKNIFKKDNPLQGAGKVCSTGVDVWSLRGAQYDIFPDVGDESVTPNHYFRAVSKKRLELIVEV